MIDHSNAEEDLRIIRSLMERATIYRAISAPTALVAGLLAILASVAIHVHDEIMNLPAIGPRQFASIWLVVLLLILIANTFFVSREAKRDGRLFVSPGMKLALRAVIPCLLIPTAFTGWFFTTGFLGAQELDLVVLWIAFYGLALLSTQLFAPRSLALLGWAFLLSGLAVPAMTNTLENLTDNLPNLAMGITFGCYHLVYAICVWIRGGARTAGQFAPE
jgi:hypothetical protein